MFEKFKEIVSHVGAIDNSDRGTKRERLRLIREEFGDHVRTCTTSKLRATIPTRYIVSVDTSIPESAQEQIRKCVFYGDCDFPKAR